MNAADFAAIMTSQLVDPFRIGLMAALIYTTIRNAAATGWLVPLAAGIIFVALIIAMTMPNGGQTQFALTASGIVANSILAAIMFGGLFIWRRFSK
jgi:hypothetical protein